MISDWREFSAFILINKHMGGRVCESVWNIYRVAKSCRISEYGIYARDLMVLAVFINNIEVFDYVSSRTALNYQTTHSNVK